MRYMSKFLIDWHRSISEMQKFKMKVKHNYLVSNRPFAKSEALPMNLKV